MVAVAGNAPTWGLIVYPAIGLIIAAVTAAAATYPLWKDRRAYRQRAQERAERLEATADAVLGRDADPSRGRAKIVGLLETTAAIKATIGDVNGSGKTVMDLVHTNTHELRRLAQGQVMMSERVEEHIKADTRQFAAIRKDIEEVRRDKP